MQSELNFNNNEEYWKEIPIYDGKYEISNLGRVRSVNRTFFLRSKKKILQGKLLKIRTNKGVNKISPEVSLGTGNNKTKVSLSRLMYITFIDKNIKNTDDVRRIKFEDGFKISNLQIVHNCQRKKIDISGQKFGGLTVLRSTKSKLWLCRCICGKEVEVSGQVLRNGKKIYCGADCYPSITKDQDLLRFESYKRAANNRGYTFDLTFDIFTNLIHQNCEYCGSLPRNQIKDDAYKDKTYKYNGIDRKDNKVGYTIDNCVTCCKMCNYAKSNFGYNEWVEWIYRISYRKDVIKKMSPHT